MSPVFVAAKYPEQPARRAGGEATELRPQRDGLHVVYATKLVRLRTRDLSWMAAPWR